MRVCCCRGLRRRLVAAEEAAGSAEEVAGGPSTRWKLKLSFWCVVGSGTCCRYHKRRTGTGTVVTRGSGEVLMNW